MREGGNYNDKYVDTIFCATRQSNSFAEYWIFVVRLKILFVASIIQIHKNRIHEHNENIQNLLKHDTLTSDSYTIQFHTTSSYNG